ncbi:MAG: hypothetical protein HY000_34680 [Planctomycetes bacterium]|nr:hypothetical protein [Planctomycetota bacterium]
MSKRRLLVLTVGPVVILAASAAGAWLTARRSVAFPLNEVILAESHAAKGGSGSPPTRTGEPGAAPAQAVPSAAHSASRPVAQSPIRPLSTDSFGDAPTSRLPDSPPRRLADVPTALEADCQRTARRLRQQLDLWPRNRGRWTLLTDPPFVVAALMSREELHRWHDHTVSPAAAALWADFFDNRPDAPITILLLPEEDSYSYCAAWLFGDLDVAYFGYYRPSERTLIVNIATGGGTLVHELTHALMAFDFAEIPDWFNEGLASLYEQCRLPAPGVRWSRGRMVGPTSAAANRKGDVAAADGTIEPLANAESIQGLVNWRLPDLQEAIRACQLRPLPELMAADDFRGPLEGLNYAQARYFCLYLQERGVLVDFYRHFRNQRGQDRTGREALRQLFPTTPIDEIDAAFRRWVLTLRWPER